MAAADYVSVVQQLYVAYFGRPADVSGLTNFTEALDATGVPATIEGVKQAYGTNATVKTLVDQFGTSTESANLYGSGTVESFVFAIYQNVLDRVPDADGFKFWVDEINAGRVARAKAALDIMAGAKANTSAQGLIDAATVDAKISVATNFTTAVTTQNATYSGDAAAATARTMLADVNNTTDVTAFQATITSTLTAITTPDAGSTFTLTTGVDAIVGTAKNDTITATSATLAASDAVVGGAGDDTLNLSLTAANAAANINGVETINADWNAFGTASFAAATVTGATINLTSSKVGFLGSAGVTGAGTNTITAGSGMVGTLTVSGVTNGTVNGTASKSLVVDGTATNANNAAVVVNAGDSTTSVNVGGTNGFIATTINANKATAVTVADIGNTTDTTAITVNANATITANVAGAMTLTASDGNSITMAGASAIGSSLAVAGAGNVTLTFADNALNAETVTNSKSSGTLTIKSGDTDGENLAKVSADLIEFTAAAGGAHTVKNGANLKYSTAAGAINVTVTGTGATDAVNVNLTKSQTSVTLTGVETLNVTAAADAVSGTDLTIGTLDTNGNKLVLLGTNDVAISAVANEGVNASAGSIDATALVGALSVTTTSTDDDFTISGGTGKLTVVSGATTAGSTAGTSGVVVVGQNDADNITTAITTGTATAVLADGKNVVTAAAITTGTLVVTAGSGDDTVTLGGSSLTSGVVNLNLGDGANTVTLTDDGVTDATSITVVTGAGDDAVSLADATQANDVLSLTLGGGTDTVTIGQGVNISAGNVTFSGVEVFQLTAGAGTDATFAAADFSGQTFTVKGAGAESFEIKGAAATTTIDASTLVIDQTIAKAVTSVVINGAAGTTAQTITGTSIADVITGGAGADVIVAGNGADTVTGGAGNDSITLTETTANSAADKVNMLSAGATNGYDTVVGFKSGTDKLQLAQDTTVGTGDGDYTTADAAVFDGTGQALAAGAAVFDLSGTLAGGVLVTTTADVVEVNTTLSSNGNLSLALDGTELLKALSSTSTASTGIKAAAIGDAFYMVAYQSDNAYLYFVNTGADVNASASEITLVGTLTGVAAGGLVAADFQIA